MLKIRSGNKIILGIDRDNVDRLKEGKPILIQGVDIGLDVEICIAYGDDLQDILDELNLPGMQ